MPIKASILSGNFIIDMDYLKKLEKELEDLKNNDSLLRKAMFAQEKRCKGKQGELISDIKIQLNILETQLNTLEIQLDALKKPWWRRLFS